VTGYRRFLHGEAIALGMCCAADLAVRLGMLLNRDAARIKRLLELYALPVSIPDDIDLSDIINAMEIDKKAQSGRLRFVLPESIGKVKIVEDVDRKTIREALETK
jgi:3-dehydroquinate synthase